MIFRTRSKLLLFLLLACFVAMEGVVAADLQDENTQIVFERPPVVATAERDHTWLQPSLRRFLTKRNLYGQAGIQQIIDEQHRWPSQSALPIVITVAFNGGDTALHKQIADVAPLWCAQANIQFDFGWDEARSLYRTWSKADDQKHAKANIRIAFTKGIGYSSLIGSKAQTDSKGNEATMNLDGFDKSLPANWSYIVLHEFGHALGLLHELQHPGQKCDLRWENDPDYKYRENRSGTAIPDEFGRRPGIYTVFGSAPNGWLRPQVDTNLGIIRDTKGLKITDFDRDSVMLYPLERWLFESPDSPCVKTQSPSLSRRDLAAIATLYPKDLAGIQRQALDLKKLDKAMNDARKQRGQ